MHILTPENTPYSLDNLPDQCDTDLMYGVLDCSDQSNCDFRFVPLLFLDSFPRPAADLRIGSYRVAMPLDWSIVVADKDFGHMEIMELKSLNDRPFTAFAINPCRGYMPSFLEITIENIFPDVTWYFPKLKFGHLLAVPLAQRPNPLCVYCIKDVNKISEVLDITCII